MGFIKAIVCTVLFFQVTNLFGQSEIYLAGQVVDGEARPVTRAEVILGWRESDGERFQNVQADDQGRFQLAGHAKQPVGNSIWLIAWKPGFAVGYLAPEAIRSWVDQEASAVRLEDVKITLPAAKPVTFAVVDPEGAPMANTALRVRGIGQATGRRAFSAEDGVELLERHTDETGTVTIDFLAPGMYGSFFVENNSLGRQNIVMTADQPEGELKLRLQPACDLKLTLNAEDATRVSGRTVSLNIRTDAKLDRNESQPVLRVVWADPELVTDASGVAKARVMAGQASAYVRPIPEDTAFPNADQLQGIKLLAGESVEHSIEFVPGIALRGRVVDTNGQPVPGVEVSVRQETLTTDEGGRYQASVPANSPAYVRVTSVPPGYVMPFDWGTQVRPEVGQQELIVPEILVGIATELKGRVIDAAGEAIAGALLRADWTMTNPEQQSFTLKSDQAVSDEEGNFSLQHVQRDSDVRLTAQTEKLASEAQILHTAEPQTVELTVSAEHMVQLVGAVKSEDGQPIQRAEIKLKRAMLSADGHNFGWRPVTLQGQAAIASEPDGSFRSPQSIPRFEQYSLEISAPGFLSHTTNFLDTPVAGDWDVGEISLTPVRSFSGVITDSSGNPLPGVTISAYSAQAVNDRELLRVSATSDAAGKFQLDQLHPQAALAFVQHPGFRLSGLPLLRGSTGSLELWREDEQIPEKYRVRPGEADYLNRGSAAEQLITSLLPQRRDSSYFHAELLKMLLRMDRDAAILELQHVTSPRTRVMVLSELGEIGEALAEAANITDPYSRCYAMLEATRKATDQELVSDALASILVEAEQIKRPDRRLLMIRSVADAFYDRGDTDTAQTILEGQATAARQLSTADSSGYTRASFGASLAVFDAEAGLKMISEAEEDDQDRHYQNAAHRLAAVNPAAAEEAFLKIESHHYIDSPVVRVVYRMAKVDLPRARRLVDSLDRRQRPNAKARGLGVMAMAVWEANPGLSRELLEDAFDAIPDSSLATGGRADDCLGTAVTLLRYAETIAPDHLTGYFWRTLQSYGGPRGNVWRPEDTEAANAERQAQLAILLILYDQPREWIEQVTEPIFRFWEKQSGEGQDAPDIRDNEAAMLAMALADPRRAVAWAIQYEQSLGENARRRIPQPWEVIGNALTFSRQELGQQITKRLYHFWVIDEYGF